MSEHDALRQKPAPDFTPISDVLSNFFPQGTAALPEEAAVEEPAAKTGKPTQKTRQPISRLAKAAAQIAVRPSDVEAAFSAKEMIQCTLPHSDPGPVSGWVRRNGDLSLVLQPALDKETMQPYGLPYGPLPRLLLLWIVTEAVRLKSRGDESRRIKLGDNLNDFLRQIGLDPSTGGGKRSDAKRLKEQMLRLFRCRISFDYTPSSGRHSWVDMQVAPKAEMWWDYRSPDQGGIFESYIILGEDFFKAITASPVPLDMRAIVALKKSPLAIDLYTWATYRVHTLNEAKRREVSIPLAFLKEQFGGEYTRLRDFKAAFAEALLKVQEVYPALDYTLEKDALVLRSGRRAVPPRDPEARRALAQEQARQMSKQISPKALKWFAENYAGWSIETAIADFDQWREHKSIVAESPDGLFKSFVRKWAKP